MTTKTEENERKKRIKPLILLLVVLFLAFVLIVMLINSRKPERLDLGGVAPQVKGVMFTAVNLQLIEQMADNWMPNDLFWPTVLLDNMPNFQIGQLEVVRYNLRVLRDNLTRMRTTDKLDPLAEGAFTALSNNPRKWWFPSAESKWKEAAKNLQRFSEDLLKGSSHFYPRADNLVVLLDQYASLLGGVNTRLILAPRDIRRVLALDDLEKDPEQAGKLVEISIPWREIDDNYYYAQGVTYALYESLRAIRVEFKEVLLDKNSLTLLDKVLESLTRCYFEPLVVFNGDPDSIFANHSLNLSGFLNDARQKITSLTVALMQG